MSWRHLLFLFCFVTFLFLIVLDGSDTIVKATEEEASEEHKTRLVRTEVEEGRDSYEERENEFWNFIEEHHDDGDDRRRERFEQWDE
ncbi:putative cartilage matrix-associated protein [Liasis olivaceus]